jgi:hypothetical protein
MSVTDPNARVVVFDGICNVCSGWVRFLQRHRIEPPFKLIPMQSQEGRVSGHYSRQRGSFLRPGVTRCIGCSRAIVTGGSDVAAPAICRREWSITTERHDDATQRRRHAASFPRFLTLRLDLMIDRRLYARVG